jgi:hypothetical protein
MPTDSEVAISLVNAIQHGHIPVEQDSDATLKRVLLSSDAPLQTAQQANLVSISEEIDRNVQAIDVSTMFLIIVANF